MSTPDPAEIFRTESQDLLERIEQGLLDLESDPKNEELIASVFRALHTLKGSGAMFGFDALATFTHHCETAFDRVRKGETRATPALINAVLSALDHMRSLAEGGRAAPENEATLLSALQAATAEAKQSDVPVADLSTECADNPSAGTTWHIRFRLPADALINGTRPLSLLDELRALGQAEVKVIRDEIPAIDQISPMDCYLGWDVLLTTSADRQDIEDVFIFAGDDLTLEPVETQSPDAEVPEEVPPETVPPKPAVMQIAQPGTGGVTTIGKPQRDMKPVVSDASIPDGGDAKNNRTVGSLRVPAERLDELMDRVAELVIAQSRLKQVSAESGDINLRAVSEEIERLASELRDTMMFVRMVPISQLFGRFRRLVHDLAIDLGKEIEFQTEGETTELDKTVIERLADPLIHLIRNSADHGLELPDVRRTSGKLPVGHIRLAARQAGAEVVITLTDDGCGINREKVRAKAEANGLIERDASLNDAELLQLIFRPGFSTASQITSLSGRGVGMDVVKRTIEALRGAISITSDEGKGTRIDLRIPLTLAIIDGLLVRVGANRYVIPLSAVEECVELSREQDVRSSGRNFLTLRGMLVPFLRLRELFSAGSEPDPYQKIVVVSTGRERVGLVVDQIVGQHQTVIKPLSRFHADVETFSGATILGDGSVSLILDIAHLVAAGQRQEEKMRAAS